MSSRALRKAQKQREEEENLKRLQAEAAELESSGGEDEMHPNPQPSAFALLGTVDDGDGDEDDDEDEARDDDRNIRSDPESRPVGDIGSPPKSNNKRKNKKKKKKTQKPPPEPTDQQESLDEIDAALKSLSVNSQSDAQRDQVSMIKPDLAEACKLLSVDNHNLHAENEMRRLFGRSAMESHDEDDQPGRGGRRNRNQQQMVGLAEALGRRQGAQGGRQRGLGLLGLRRNLFIQGKEEWPVGTSGGLSMEVVEKRSDGIYEYRFVHNTAYQAVQSQFDVCVRSMDPERMIHHLQLNPYHISTLLQVSEIAKQERDHSVAGDLLERALFSFGRALHSTFAGKLAEGKARMDFGRPENREFWLAVSRYITNLSMRSTWRTVFEWAKLLLSLDPDNDPYKICLVIDQYAIRARQPQHLIDMVQNPVIAARWNRLPNINVTLGLALAQTGQSSKGKQALFKATNQFPWVIARLFQELNIDAPPGVWGKSPRTDWEKLMSELYAVRAKDIWNIPEASNMLVEVSSAVSGGVLDPPIPSDEVTLDEGRHVLGTDKPEMIALLPRSITSRVQSASDPLTPEDNNPSYSLRASTRSGRDEGASAAGYADLNAALQHMAAGMVGGEGALQGFFERLRSFMPSLQTGPAETEDAQDDNAGLREVLEAHGAGRDESAFMARQLLALAGPDLGEESSDESSDADDDE